MAKVTVSSLLKSTVHIVGVSGAEGSAIARWLIKSGNDRVVGHDFKTAAEFDASFRSYHASLPKTEQTKLLSELKHGLAKLHLRDTYLAGLAEADYVIVPMAWFRYSPNKPKLTTFIKKNPSKVVSGYTLLLELYGGTTVRVLAQALPKAITFGGPWQHVDFGKILEHGRRGGTLVMEVNNRQLTLAPYRRVSPSIAVITNITVNHLDDHGGSFAAYRKAKWQILAYQKRGDVAVLNADDPSCRLFARRGYGRVRLFSVAGRPDVDATIRESWFSIRRGRAWQRVASLASVPPLLRTSPHLQADALAALLAADAAGASVRAMASALWRFGTEDGRLTVVTRQRNITYVNDTASTRPEATAAAAAAFVGSKLHLIIGGSRLHPRAEQYEAMFKKLKALDVQTVALIGALAPWLAKRAARVGLKDDVVAQVGTLPKAVALCQRRAAHNKEPQAIILSPGCESFGEFHDYRERGDKFRQVVGLRC
jgi:UDP-N-acetylmuramoylalanine-D-glutamate ligase